MTASQQLKGHRARSAAKRAANPVARLVLCPNTPFRARSKPSGKLYRRRPRHIGRAFD